MVDANTSDEIGSALTVDKAAEKIAQLMDPQPADSPQESESQQPPEEMAAESDDVSDEESQDADVDADDVDDEQEEAQQQLTAADDAIVEIDGVAIPVAELKKSYFRQSDYTRKAQALAEQRKAAEAEANAVRAERTQYAQLLGALQQQLQASQEVEPNWDQLYAEDPIEWVRQREVWRSKQEQKQAIAAEQMRLQQQMQAEQVQWMQGRLQHERVALQEAIPEWKDVNTAKREKQALVEYGVANGFNEADMRGISDHKVVALLRKAYLYDRMQQSRQQAKPVQRQAIKPAAPGPAPKQVSSLTRAKQRLAKTHSVKDAAAAIELLMGK